MNTTTHRTSRDVLTALNTPLKRAERARNQARAALMAAEEELLLVRARHIVELDRLERQAENAHLHAWMRAEAASKADALRTELAGVRV